MKRTAAWVVGLGIVAASMSSGAAAPAAQTPPNCLASYWNLDDSASPAIDSIAGNNGQHVNGPVIMTANAPAAIQFQNDGYLDFEESLDQYVSVPDSPETSLTGSFTLSAWIRPESLPGHQQGIIEKWTWDSGLQKAVNGYMMRLDGSGYLTGSIAGPPGNAGPFGGGTGNPVPTDGTTWTHVAMVFDINTGNIQLFINGSADGGGSSPELPPDGGGNLEIGRGIGAQQFDGSIDDVRIYNCALLASDVADLANGIDVGGGAPAPAPTPTPTPTPSPGPSGTSSSSSASDDGACGCSSIHPGPVPGWLALLGLGLAILIRRPGR